LKIKLIAIASLLKIVNRLKGLTVLLKEVLEVKQGIVPGIDHITPQNIKFIPSEKVAKEGIRIGNGVFVLTKTEAEDIGISPADKKLLIPSYRNSHITQYIVDVPEGELDYILYIEEDLDFSDLYGVKKHLQKFKEVLKVLSISEMGHF